MTRKYLVGTLTGAVPAGSGAHGGRKGAYFIETNFVAVIYTIRILNLLHASLWGAFFIFNRLQCALCPVNYFSEVT